MSQGEFHESLNLASLWNLPIIFFLENNLYGMGTHVERTHAGGRDIYLSADSYRIRAAQVDGMDVLAIQEATNEALEIIRKGEGPVFIEAMTYRFVGHSVQDPQAYRESEEIEQWRAKDPIKTFKESSLSQGLVDEQDIAGIDEKVAQIVAEATKFAEESPEPPIESLYENVYGPNK